MQEIAGQGRIEEDAIIQYIIDGVPDDEVGKTVLYGSRTIRELKENFEIYDRLKERAQRRGAGMKKKSNVKNDARETKVTQSKLNSKQPDKKHCFHCGSTEQSQELPECQ